MNNVTVDDNEESTSKRREGRPLLFNHFKMALYASNGRDESIVTDDDDSKVGDRRDLNRTITSVDGRQYESKRVLQAALSFIKDEVMAAVRGPHNIESIDGTFASMSILIKEGNGNMQTKISSGS